ncbi:hypothetical protein B0H17DRAFT_1141696 [Mycena rosella]|uniref:DUF6589 domain-containing protein n=1 Tax=Mycena rosella TaxID=1033263 RepID=A0AAD7GAA3_MYCRO|nr:hypothetical protein B0H17DRAFT_1141696 [Mycena rosella]
MVFQPLASLTLFLLLLSLVSAHTPKFRRTAAFKEIRSFASVHITEFNHPAIVLEHSAYVESTECDSNSSTITVSFKRRAAWEMARRDDTGATTDSSGAADDGTSGTPNGNDGDSAGVTGTPSKTTTGGTVNDGSSGRPTTSSGAQNAGSTGTTDTDGNDGSSVPMERITAFKPSLAWTKSSWGLSAVNDTAFNGVSDFSGLDDNRTTDAEAEALWESWWSYEAAEDAKMGYIPQDELGDAFWDAQLAPEPDDSPENGTVIARGECALTWKPWEIIKNCVLLPLVKAILPTPIYKTVETLTTLFSEIHVFYRRPCLIGTKARRLYHAFNAVSTAFVAILNEKGYRPSGEVGVVGEGKFSAFCVGCRASEGLIMCIILLPNILPRQLTVHKYIKYRSAFKFTLASAQFTSAEVEVLTGNLALNAGLGLEFDSSAGGKEIPLKFSKDFPMKFKKLPKIPLSALAIPGIFVIGPYISFNIASRLSASRVDEYQEYLSAREGVAEGGRGGLSGGGEITLAFPYGGPCKRRNCLKPDIVEALQFLNCLMRRDLLFRLPVDDGDDEMGVEPDGALESWDMLVDNDPDNYQLPFRSPGLGLEALPQGSGSSLGYLKPKPPQAEPKPGLPGPAGPCTSLHPRLRKAKLTAEQKRHKKFRAMEKLLKEYPFRNLGEFLAILFHNPIRGEPDPRGTKHSRVVARFLRSQTNIKMSDILPLIYSHKASYPASKSADVHEQKEMFATTRPAHQIHHARPFISTRATRLVAFEGRKQVGRSAQNDPDDPERRDNLRVQTNGRKEGVEVVSWPAVLSHFNLRHIGTQYCIRLPLVWFCTEVWSAPMAKGVFFVRKRRPHPIICLSGLRSTYSGGLNSFRFKLARLQASSHRGIATLTAISRWFSASGTLFGYGVSDSTARNALNTMTDASLHELREKIKDATSRCQTENALLLDNVQEYCDVYEQGIGRLSELKVGTAGTNLDLDDCAPGAFDAEPYYNKVAQQELDTDSHRIAIDFYSHMLKDVIAMFREEPLALRCMCKGRKTGCQPVTTNGERSTSLQGFERAVDDFDTQRGIDSGDPGNLLSWIQGDGASYANALHLTTLCTPQGTFKNKIATSEIWHTGATDLNSTAANHYGPATSLDQSSLSKASNIAGLKRPSNIKSCDYYPTVRNLTLIWKAHVLDCWCVFFETDDLHAYFRNLASTNQLPPLEELLGYAMVLVDRYATQSAIQASLLASESLDPARGNKVPAGSDWEAPTHTNLADSSNDDEDLPGLVDIAEPEPQANPVPPKSDDAPKFHEEKEGQGFTESYKMPTEHSIIPGGRYHKTLAYCGLAGLEKAGPPVKTSWDLTTSCKYAASVREEFSPPRYKSPESTSAQQAVHRISLAGEPSVESRPFEGTVQEKGP